MHQPLMISVTTTNTQEDDAGHAARRDILPAYLTWHEQHHHTIHPTPCYYTTIINTMLLFPSSLQALFFLYPFISSCPLLVRVYKSHPASNALCLRSCSPPAPPASPAPPAPPAHPAHPAPSLRPLRTCVCLCCVVASASCCVSGYVPQIICDNSFKVPLCYDLAISNF